MARKPTNTIKSFVVDIRDARNYQGASDIRVFVDTNVWFWFSYTKASLDLRDDRKREIDSFLQFINFFLSKKTLYSCGLIYAELTSLVERTELELYRSKLSKPDSSMGLKKFRREYPRSRLGAIKEAKLAWEMVESCSELIPMNLDLNFVQAASKQATNFLLDSYDLFYYEIMRINKIDCILTDDKDFLSVPGLKVFTANNQVIREAKNLERLILVETR